jgi:hypothetical protein
MRAVAYDGEEARLRVVRDGMEGMRDALVAATRSVGAAASLAHHAVLLMTSACLYHMTLGVCLHGVVALVPQSATMHDSRLMQGARGQQDAVITSDAGSMRVFCCWHLHTLCLPPRLQQCH